MGSVKVTVYGRAKPCIKDSPTQEFIIKNGEQEDHITFFSNKIPNAKKTYRFKKIFNENASQEDIFETVAKPIIKSVLSGYNGTIFTYGQTGSGKTYTMTGDLDGWINPGLIPRTVQEIFKQKNTNTPITITYCEIYNEHVYDLIRVDPMDSDLPQVSILEDSAGITHFRNLSVHLVRSSFEALQLLVRGDANKMVAETNSNVRSSRSHVIFSIGLELPHPTEDKLCLKPVLYLVDLAGSEKLSKCKTPTNNPLETRYINLSLHYLEQVLIALRQPGRNHIPYRNSLMTALLRNSLGGNCITAMIATFSLSIDDLDETMQTCRFAERIALIKNEVKLSEIIDPQKQIYLLKKENDKLKAQLKLIGFSQGREELDDKDRAKCIEMVQNFIRGNDIFDLPVTDARRMKFCAQIMRDEIVKKGNKQQEEKKYEKKESVLELLKKNSSMTRRDYQIHEKLSQETMAKIMESNGARKRNPINLPKINLTYKRWKSTEEISENESTLKDFSSKELKTVGSNYSNSTQSQKVHDRSSDYSLERSTLEVSSQDTEHLETYEIDGCFIESRDSEMLSMQKDTIGGLNSMRKTEVNKNYLSTEVSRVFMKTELPTPIIRVKALKSVSSDEKIDIGEMKKLKSVGIQVDEVSETTDEVTISSKVDLSSVLLSETETFPGVTLPLTGDREVDEEIVNFYKARYESFKKKDSIPR